MDGLFKHTIFNGNISLWNVSRVKVFDSMFESSSFNGDLSRWNVSQGSDFRNMFASSAFNGDISSWDMRQAVDLNAMFKNAKFCGDLSGWVVQDNANLQSVFEYNDRGYDAQKMTPFLLNILLQHGKPLPDLTWRLAVHKYRKLKDALGLDPSTMTADIFNIHAARFKELDILSVDDLDLDNPVR